MTQTPDANGCITLNGLFIDYTHLTQYPERRIEHLLETCWEDTTDVEKRYRHPRGNYIVWFSFE